MDRRRAERYRDRYLSGRHARVNRLEHAALRELLGPLAPMEVTLDLPCGAGRVGDVLAEVSQRVILADSSPLMLEMAREQCGDQGYTYLQTLAEKIDLPDGSADLILCHRLLNHIPEPASRAAIMKELARVTRRYLLISCYASGVRTRMKSFLRRLIPGRRPVKTPPTLREYLDLARESGFRVAQRSVLRRIPSRAEFVLFERTPDAGR